MLVLLYRIELISFVPATDAIGTKNYFQ